MTQEEKTVLDKNIATFFAKRKRKSIAPTVTKNTSVSTGISADCENADGSVTIVVSPSPFASDEVRRSSRKRKVIIHVIIQYL